MKNLKQVLQTIPGTGGYSHKNGVIIMCAVSNNDYYLLKKRILEIDPSAFMIIDKMLWS